MLGSHDRCQRPHAGSGRKRHQPRRRHSCDLGKRPGFEKRSHQEILAFQCIRIRWDDRLARDHVIESLAELRGGRPRGGGPSGQVDQATSCATTGPRGACRAGRCVQPGGSCGDRIDTRPRRPPCRPVPPVVKPREAPAVAVAPEQIVEKAVQPNQPAREASGISAAWRYRAMASRFAWAHWRALGAGRRPAQIKLVRRARWFAGRCGRFQNGRGPLVDHEGIAVVRDRRCLERLDVEGITDIGQADELERPPDRSDGGHQERDRNRGQDPPPALEEPLEGRSPA